MGSGPFTETTNSMGFFMPPVAAVPPVLPAAEGQQENAVPPEAPAPPAADVPQVAGEVGEAQAQ
jgi:hypothetical protein